MSNTKIGFNNFKAFGPKMQYFTKKPITLIYGPNSTGKSSFLHMLMYKNYVVKTKNPNLLHTDMFGDSLDIGGFDNFVHSHNINSIITFEDVSQNSEACLQHLVDFLFKNVNRENANYIQSFIDSSSSFSKKTHIKKLPKNEFGMEFEIEIKYLVNDNDLLSYTKSTKSTNSDTDLFKGSMEKIKTYDHPIFTILNLPSLEINGDFLTNLVECDNDVMEQWVNALNISITGEMLFLGNFNFIEFFHSNFISHVEKYFTVNSMQYIGPLRFYPYRGSVSSDSKILEDTYNNIYSSENMWKVLLDSPFSDINKYLKKLGMEYEIQKKSMIDIDDVLMGKDDDSVTKDQLMDRLKSASKKSEIVFKDLKRGIKLSNRDLGSGISQVLPILIAAKKLDHAQIIIEQPELHLHPKAQCDLADIFIENKSRIGKTVLPDVTFNEGNDFIIETHSEHLLLRIMKRMRQTAEGKLEDESLRLTPDDVCLLYVDNHRGNTFIRELKLDVDGRLLTRWPNGFFDESYKEIFS